MVTGVNAAPAAPLLPDPHAPHRVVCGERTYLLRVPRLLDRIALTREIAGLGGRQHGMILLLDAAAEGARSILTEPEARAAVVGRIEAQRDRWREAAELSRERDPAKRDETRARLTAVMQEIAAEERELGEIDAGLRQLWPRYATMIADNAAYPEIRMVALVRLFLVGWEGMAVPFPPLGRGQRAPDALIETIPEADLWEIATEAERLLAPSAEQEKN